MQSERSIPFSYQLLWSFIITLVITDMKKSLIFHNAGSISVLLFLVAHQTCFKSNREAGFRTQDLSHAKRTLHH